MGTVVRFPGHATSARSDSAKNSSSGKPVARLNRAASGNEGARQPVSMREIVAGVLPAASATSLSDSFLAMRWARNGCMENSLPRWKGAGQEKLSIADKDVSTAETYAGLMVTRIGPRKPRQRAYIREHRKARGWSQDDLAGRLGTTAATISRYETGSRDYPGGFLAAVAEAFGVSEGDLYHLPTTEAAQIGAPSFEAMLHNAPPAIQELARAAARAILETHILQEPTKKRGKTGT